MRLAESDDSYPRVVAILNGRGRYHPSSHALDAARNPTKPGTFSCLKTDRVNRAHWREAGAAALIQKHHAPVNVIGGFKFANAPVIDLGTVPTASSEPTPLPASTEGDGLDIPDFLVRTH
jgi:hypothetical protein